MWGRTIYENVRKFVQFQLTMNISLLTVVFLAAVSVGQPPFSVIQLLWMNLVMDVLAASAICTEPFVHTEDETLQRISRKEKLIKPVMWRNILPQALYQVIVMIILMFGGQAMYWTPFNIITMPQRDSEGPTDRLRKDTLCFHTFMLMNLINMINCRVVRENEPNVFKTLLNNKQFWFIFIIEMAVQNAMVAFAQLEKPFDIIGVIVGTADMPWTAHLTAWIFGLFTLAIRPLTQKIPVDKFYFMEALDLETVNNDANFVTRYAQRATDDYARIGNEEADKETPEDVDGVKKSTKA